MIALAVAIDEMMHEAHDEATEHHDAKPPQ